MNELIQRMVQSLVKTYALEDPSAPSILISLVENEAVSIWYVAAHRYRKAFGNGRVVVDSATDVNLDTALRTLAIKLGVTL